MKRKMDGISSYFGVSFLILGILLLAGSLYTIRADIFDQEQQNALTPDMALQDLIEGNKRFCSNTARQRSAPTVLLEKAHEKGQFPKAVILACMDSRSIPELVFDQSIADIFTLRVAGNVVNDDMIASMEYATKYSGSKLIVVMGHTNCGAIKAACEGAGSGYLVSLVETLSPAVQNVTHHKLNKKLDCSDAETVKKIAWQNVRNMVKKISKKSATIRKLVSQGKAKIVGALHHLETGIVTFE